MKSTLCLSALVISLAPTFGGAQAAPVAAAFRDNATRTQVAATDAKEALVARLKETFQFLRRLMSAAGAVRRAPARPAATQAPTRRWQFRALSVSAWMHDNDSRAARMMPEVDHVHDIVGEHADDQGHSGTISVLLLQLRL